MQQSGDGVCLPMDGHRNRQPYLRHQKRVMSLSDVVVSVHAGDCANAPRQTCPALPCVPAMAIAIKSDRTFQVHYFVGQKRWITLRSL